nr:MAG TPA: hypothetical protein [Caudoviricetes sp.]
MDILGKEILIEYCKVYPNARSSIDDWIVAIEVEQFKKPQDIKNRFSSVDFLPKNHCIFNINGNHHRLCVQAIYVAGRLIVKWIGTHAEYDKKDFNKLAQGK